MTTGEAPEHSSKQFVSIIQRVLACERGLLLQEGYFINNGVFAIPKFDQIRAGAIALQSKPLAASIRGATRRMLNRFLTP